VPETEGPVKATDQLNGQEKMWERERIKYGRDAFWVRSGDAERVGSRTESELIVEGMCFGLGQVLWKGSGGCWEQDREREIKAEQRGE